MVDPDTSVQHGTTVTVECERDYELVGNNTSVCSNGVYSSVPLCKSLHILTGKLSYVLQCIFLFTAGIKLKRLTMSYPFSFNVMTFNQVIRHTCISNDVDSVDTLLFQSCVSMKVSRFIVFYSSVFYFEYKVKRKAMTRT